MKHGLSLFGLLLSLAMTFQAQAGQIANLYQADVEVKANGDWQQEALTQILIRVSGKADVISQSAIKAELSKASTYVKQFENVRLDNTNRMRVLLDANKINQLLQKNNVAVWGALRPDTLVWLVNQQNDGREFVRQTDSSLNLAMQQAFKEAALPLLIPLYDMDDLLHLTETDVWAAFWQPVMSASARYKADAIIVGSVEQERIDENVQYKLIWQRQHDGRTLRDEVVAADEKTLMTLFATTVASQLSDIYASVLSSDSASRFIIKVEELDGLSDIVQVQRLLQQVVGVNEVTIKNFLSGHAYYEVEAVIASDALLNALGFNRQLQAVENQEAISLQSASMPALATYRFMRN